MKARAPRVPRQGRRALPRWRLWEGKGLGGGREGPSPCRLSRGESRGGVAPWEPGCGGAQGGPPHLARTRPHAAGVHPPPETLLPPGAFSGFGSSGKWAGGQVQSSGPPACPRPSPASVQGGSVGLLCVPVGFSKLGR